MSRVTAAFVCALCDPDNPRPASIMCSNNCGRYVCAVHAVSRKGPGSAMVCLSCAEALGLADKPKPKPAPEVRPLLEIPSEPTPEPALEPTLVVASVAAPIEAATPMQVEPAAAPALNSVEPLAEAEVASTAMPDTLSPGAPTEAIPMQTHIPEAVIAGNVVPADQQSTARRIVEPETPPKSAASETVVSQRGNTLQVPKVTPGMGASGTGTPALGKPPTPIGPSPRKAQRASERMGSSLDWTLIGSVIGSVVLGIAGLVLILVAITP